MKLYRSLLIALVAVPVVSHAFVWTKTITTIDPDGVYTYSAQADFTQVGSDLVVVLTNIADTSVTKRRRVLTAVFWDLTGNPNLVKDSASITAGSSQINGGDPPANIGAHWAFKQAIGPNQWGNARYGISSVGLGVFGPGNTFPPGGGSPNGIDYGIVSNVGTTLGDPLVKNSMTFHLDLPVGYVLTEDGISNVWFQYGSATDEFFFNVPEPGSMAALGIGALALLARKRRKS